MPTRSRFPRSATALLVVDAINPCDFPGGASFAKRARKTALSIARLAARARRRRVPVIFVNDNLGRWRSDAASLVKFVATTPALTAADAYMRDFKVVVPRDCVAALSAADQKIGLQQLLGRSLAPLVFRGVLFDTSADRGGDDLRDFLISEEALFQRCDWRCSSRRCSCGLDPSCRTLGRCFTRCASGT